MDTNAPRSTSEPTYTGSDCWHAQKITDLEAQLGVQACRVATLERELALWLNDRQRLTAENAELRAALKPFADYDSSYPDCCPLFVRPELPPGTSPNVGHCRHAHRLLGRDAK